MWLKIFDLFTVADSVLDSLGGQTRTQSLFMCFGGERRLGVRLRSAGSHEKVCTRPRFESEGRFLEVVKGQLTAEYQVFLEEKGEKKSENLLSRSPLEKPDTQTSLLKDQCISVIICNCYFK